MKQEYNNEDAKFQNYFSNLSEDELTFIRQTEKKINEQHTPSICLIAYDKK